MMLNNPFICVRVLSVCVFVLKNNLQSLDTFATAKSPRANSGVPSNRKMKFPRCTQKASGAQRTVRLRSQLYVWYPRPFVVATFLAGQNGGSYIAKRCGLAERVNLAYRWLRGSTNPCGAFYAFCAHHKVSPRFMRGYTVLSIMRHVMCYSRCPDVRRLCYRLERKLQSCIYEALLPLYVDGLG